MSQPPSSKYNRGLFIALIGLLLTITMAAIYIWQPTFLVFLNHKTYDTLLRLVGQARPSGQVAIVDVDESSVARYGQWPWPHYRLARLFSAINELGAASVAVDFLLSEPDRTSLSVIQQDMARELGVKTVSPCDPAVAQKHTGYLVGGISPFGTRKRLPVMMQVRILDLQCIYINAGRRGLLAELDPKELKRVLDAKPVKAAR